MEHLHALPAGTRLGETVVAIKEYLLCHPCS